MFIVILQKSFQIDPGVQRCLGKKKISKKKMKNYSVTLQSISLQYIWNFSFAEEIAGRSTNFLHY